MQSALRLCLLMVSLWLSPQGHASGSAPITLRDGLIQVQVDVPGFGPARFLVDSGAGSSLVDSRLARTLQLAEGRAHRVQGVHGVLPAMWVSGLRGSVAGVSLPESALAVDLRKLAGMEVDGLLGIDFFKDRAVQIDLARRQLRVLTAAERANLAGESLPLTKRNDCYAVRVSVDGSDPHWLRVDTGCETSVEWIDGSGRTGRSKAPVQLGSVTVPSVNIGRHTTPFFRGERGLLGIGLLGQFRTTIDLPGKRLVLAKN